MCFVIDDLDHIDGQIAEEDITCYKVMRRSIDNGVHVYKSILYGTKWVPLNSIIRPTYSRELEKHARQLNGSAVHAYQALTPGIMEFSIMGCVPVIKCIIPKGARYWTNNNRNEIAATKIKLIKEVNFSDFV